MARKFFVGGNFKMNGTIQTITQIIANLKSASLDPNTEVVIAPPAIYLVLARELSNGKFSVSAQNVFDKPNVDSGRTQRTKGYPEEDDDFVARKTKAAIDGGLSVILCIGESLEEREAGKTLDVVTRQLNAVAERLSSRDWSKVVIAYEPIWAIGTGKVATTEQAQEVHASIRKWLGDKISADTAENVRVIYGGSVTEKNCRDLAQQPDVDGFLVGGASLKPAFVDIINSRL
ncbi:triosephosphate isomerase [Histoplasma capsulatum G186AR]|uniref:Triosephosphate isomerase n=1 Tax=Ajellomyces capsulatus (strain G186AR / H82 / ATCC MYA-2454 / RMSCC 2432) TaxID=447093 RepID=C0NFD3_AJECG|nr:triosephosphate isomerase [Histoplasma capsulatum G186AR]EEH09954.1 triosephosphate isomerase [Histoplasma capsulatum G186AR]